MRAIDAGILICTECHELNKQEADTDEQLCTRCGALIHARRPWKCTSIIAPCWKTNSTRPK